MRAALRALPCRCSARPERSLPEVVPATYRIDAARSLVYSRYQGVLTDDELQRQQAALGEDPAFDARFRQLVDVRDVTDIRVAAATIAAVARRTNFRPGTWRAIVAAAEAPFGVARMFALYAENRAQVVRVFHGIAEAEAWLGLPPGTGDALRGAS
jgi:hypothetical protein